MYSLHNQFRQSGLLIFTILMLGVQVEILGQVPKWFTDLKQIKLLKSTKPELEKLFSKYSKVDETDYGDSGLEVVYRLRNIRISVLYSKGPCKTKTPYGYDVAESTVIEIEVDLGDESAKISRFGFDLKKFEKERVEDILGTFVYTNIHEGIRFFGSSSRLSTLELMPLEEQEKQMSCAYKLVESVREE